MSFMGACGSWRQRLSMPLRTSVARSSGRHASLSRTLPITPPLSPLSLPLSPLSLPPSLPPPSPSLSHQYRSFRISQSVLSFAGFLFKTLRAGWIISVRACYLPSSTSYQTVQRSWPRQGRRRSDSSYRYVSRCV